MRFMIHVEVPTDVGNKLDFEEGGPGRIFKYLAERFNPEVFYASPARRAIWMVAHLDEPKMIELMFIISKRLGVYPLLTPVAPGSEVPELAEGAGEAVKNAPL